MDLWETLRQDGCVDKVAFLPSDKSKFAAVIMPAVGSDGKRRPKAYASAATAPNPSSDLSDHFSHRDFGK